MTALPPVCVLPTPRLTNPTSGLSLLLPLSRRSTGPGMILLVPDSSSTTLKNDPNPSELLKIENGIPSSLMKWAEEGYTVVQIEERAINADALHQAVDIISECEQTDPKNIIGLIAYGASLWNKAVRAIDSIDAIKATVIYSDDSDIATLSQSSQPAIHHVSGSSNSRSLARSEKLTQHAYPTTKTTKFAVPFQPEFDYRAESISHTRNLTHLKRHMNAPCFDLEKIWDEHTYYEFENRSVEHTMATMVQEPYVNHIPTLTGGIGRNDLTHFYRNHFIWSNPDDTELELVSRTVGIDRVVDEFIFKFTHVKQVDWILPGIAPTGRHLCIPFTAIVNIRGDRLYHEHIAWDQATVLRQLGLLPEYLPLPGSAGRYEYQIPVAGAEAAQKMVDKNSVASNQMFGYGNREVEKAHP